MNVWRCTQLPPDRWLSAVVRNLHPDDTLQDLQLHRGLSPLEARQAANVTRVWMLHDHGGLWLDNDVVPLRRLTGAPAPWVAECAGRLEGCAMWFPAPGHRFLRILMGLVEAAPHSLLARHLHHARQLEPIAGEVRVLPFDAHGAPTGVTDPWAVHTWATSSRNLPQYAVPHG